MAINIHDVAADTRALRSVMNAMRNIASVFEEEEHIIKACGKCGLCGADIGLKFSAILTRKHGTKSIALRAVDACCRRRTPDDVLYVSIHPDHQ